MAGAEGVGRGAGVGNGIGVRGWWPAAVEWHLNRGWRGLSATRRCGRSFASPARPLLPPMGMFRAGLADGVDGWADDDLAFVKPWGFDVGAIAVPVLIWQGAQDEMVPGAHGRWLREDVAGAEGGVLDGEGHLTLFVNRVGKIQECLLERLR